MRGYLSSENLKKEPEVGIVPHKSLFDTSLNSLRIYMYSGKVFNQRKARKEEVTSTLMVMVLLQDLEVAEFGKLPRDSSTEPVSVQSPAYGN